MSTAAPLQRLAARPGTPGHSGHAGLLLQRKCACGAPTALLTGECAECKSKKRLQTKLTISASNDPLEQEADRVADQVLAAPANPAVGRVRSHIQRFAGQPTASTGTVPASVDHVLATPGRPLGSALRQDMEQRFGHDFSRVRVHSGTAAEQSAREVNAKAYTVGHDIVFGADQYATGTDAGRHLIAHELTHVVQQSGSEDTPRIDQSNKRRQALGRPDTATALLGRRKTGAAIVDVQRSAGNLAVGQLYRKEAVDVKGAAEKIGIGVAEQPPSDEVDAFLESRRSLYHVALVGTNVHVTLSRSHKWTAHYTNRALTEGALGAAINMIYMGGATATQVRKAYEKVVGNGVKLTLGTQEMQGEDAVHMTIIDKAAMAKIAAALNLTPTYTAEAWRVNFGEAKMIEFALGSASKSFDSLVPLFSAKDLAATGMTVAMIRFLLDKRDQSMIEVAKRHPATAPWRAAFKRNLALHWAEREPTLDDFDKVPLSQWAKTILDLAAVTRTTLNEQTRLRREEDKRRGRNEQLLPREIKVDDAASYILQTFDPTHEERLDPYPWVVRGGQTLSNGKNEPIYLLRVETDRLIFQHLGDKKIYEQTLEGFSDELQYGVFTAAGQKSEGAIVLTKWVLGVAGAVFPPVRYGLMATEVLSVAFKLQANREQLERHYDDLKLAYANIDAIMPGMLPKLWEAVLDKRNVLLFNPLQNPDFGAWLKVVIRLVMLRQARVATASYVADAVNGFLKAAWAAIKKALGVLLDVVIHTIVIGPAVVGSTGVSGHRALEIAERRLTDIGVVQAAALTAQIKALPEGTQQRLVREIEDLRNNGTKLVEIVKEVMSW